MSVEKRLDLRFIPTAQLIPHEDTIERKLASVRSYLIDNRVMPHPIIAAELSADSFLIADGHHRYEATRQLGCDLMLCHVADYKDGSSIQLSSWAHIVRRDAHSLAQRVRTHVPHDQLSMEPVAVHEANQKTQSGEVLAAVVDRTGGWTFRAVGDADRGRLLGRLYEVYAESHIDNLPVDDMIPSALWDLEAGISVVLVQGFTVPQLAKLVKRGPISMPKFTRFVVPGGKLADAFCPLHLLRTYGSNGTSKEAIDAFESCNGRWAATAYERDMWLYRLLGRPLETVRRFPWPDRD